MKYGDIKGDVTHDKHKGWLQIDSVQFAVARSISTVSGRTQNRESSLAALTEVTVSKAMDGSGPKFFLEACIGHAGKDAMINFVRTGASAETYLTLWLTNALVSSYAFTSDGDRPAETILINFTKIEMKHTSMKSDASIGSVITVSYDLMTGKGS